MVLLMVSGQFMVAPVLSPPPSDEVTHLMQEVFPVARGHGDHLHPPNQLLLPQNPFPKHELHRTTAGANTY